MLLSDLIQPRATGWRGPQGGPAIPVLPKAQSNAMGTAIGTGPQPKQMTPAELLNSITAARSAESNIALTEAQKLEIMAKLRDAAEPPPPMYADDVPTARAPAGAPGAERAAVPPRDGIDFASVGRNAGASSDLAALANQVAPNVLPSGYRVAVTSQDRPEARVAGTGGISQHALGNAIDVQITDPQGNAIPNTGEDTTGLYGKLAQGMYRNAPPEMAGRLGWGGNFTTGPANGKRDLMHFDLAGDRGRFGSLAAQAGGAQQSPAGLAQLAPGLRERLGMAAPAKPG